MHGIQLPAGKGLVTGVLNQTATKRENLIAKVKVTLAYAVASPEEGRNRLEAYKCFIGRFTSQYGPDKELEDYKRSIDFILDAISTR